MPCSAAMSGPAPAPRAPAPGHPRPPARCADTGHSSRGRGRRPPASGRAAAPCPDGRAAAGWEAVRLAPLCPRLAQPGAGRQRPEPVGSTGGASTVGTSAPASVTPVSRACTLSDRPRRRASTVWRSREDASVVPSTAHSRRRSASPRAGTLRSASSGQRPSGSGAVKTCRATRTWPKTASSVVGRRS